MEKLENCQDEYIFVRKLIEMKKQPEVVESDMGENPFVQELVIEASRRVDSKKLIADENGEMVPLVNIVEKSEYTKLYKTAALRERAMNLSTGATKMYVYILHSLEASQDWIRIVPEWYTKKAGKSLNVYKDAIKELCRYGYITPTIYKYVYWVNPSLMFNGSRINKYPEKVVVKNTWVV